MARYVALREAGQPPVAREHRARPIDDYLDKIEELVARSNGRVRADVVHERPVAMGFGRWHAHAEDQQFRRQPEAHRGGTPLRC